MLVSCNENQPKASKEETSTSQSEATSEESTTSQESKSEESSEETSSSEITGLETFKIQFYSVNNEGAVTGSSSESSFYDKVKTYCTDEQGSLLTSASAPDGYAQINYIGNKGEEGRFSTMILGSQSQDGSLKLDFNVYINKVKVEAQGYCKHIAYNDTWSVDSDCSLTLNGSTDVLNLPTQADAAAEVKTKEYNITHLLLTDCFNIYHEEAETRKRFEDMCVSAKKISDELGLDFISIYTNENIFWYPHFVDLYCMRYCSLPYALQKLFAVYNYSTSYQYKDFTFKAENRDASHYDFFTVHLISNENITFSSSGGEASRADKAEYIANNKVVQKYLQVCNLHPTVNCCVCDKCIRTQLDLYACKKIQKFDAVFDLNEFEKNKNRSLQNVIVRGSDFDKEILLKLRKNNISISSKIIIKATVIKFLKKLIKMFKPIYCFLWEIKNRDNPFDESDKYNKDYCYAKECNPEIVSLHR